jgi:hypothetical protein
MRWRTKIALTLFYADTQQQTHSSCHHPSIFEEACSKFQDPRLFQSSYSPSYHRCCRRSFFVNRKMKSLFILILAVCSANAFVPVQQQNVLRSTSSSLNGIFDKMGDKMGEMFEELDAFVDDATSRRLGAGAAFYGKRKSKFYGEKDIGRKSDKNVADPTGEYSCCCCYCCTNTSRV